MGDVEEWRTFVWVHKTEHKEEAHATFKIKELMQKLTLDNDWQILRFEVFNYKANGSHKLFGSFETSAKDISEGAIKFKLWK